MPQREINIGSATYTVQRSFQGEQPLVDLLAQQLLRQALPTSSFDGSRSKRYNGTDGSVRKGGEK